MKHPWTWRFKDPSLENSTAAARATTYRHRRAARTQPPVSVTELPRDACLQEQALLAPAA